MLHIQILKVPRFKEVGLTRNDMRKIGAKAISTIQERVSRGVGLNDRRMKPLSPRYAAGKRTLGQPPVRNMMFSGSMLGAMTIVDLQANQVTLGFTRRSELVKAQKNQERTPWFGLSRRDEEKVVLFASKVLRQKAPLQS